MTKLEATMHIVKSQSEEITQLKDDLIEARQDTERLDWMIAHEVCVEQAMEKSRWHVFVRGN